MEVVFDGGLKINSFSNVEIIQQDKVDSYTAILLRIKTNFTYQKDNLTYKNQKENLYNKGKGDITFYYLVQVVKGKVYDAALSEDYSNDHWINIKKNYPSETISAIKNKIKDIFNQYLEGELIACP